MKLLNECVKTNYRSFLQEKPKKESLKMIECMNFKSHESGTLLGFATLFLPKMGLEIFGCSMHKKGDRRWLNLPSREFEENGEKKYLNVIRFREKSHYESFCSEAKKAIDKWIEEREENLHEPLEPSQQEMPF